MSTTARGGRRSLVLVLALGTASWLAEARASEPLDHHRNRLLDTLALHRGFPDRCAFWATLEAPERGVFLTHTDLLGNRSCFGLRATCAARDEQALDHVVRLWALRGTDASCPGCNGGLDWHRSFWQADAALLLHWRALAPPLPDWRASHDFMGPHRPFDWSLETEVGPPRGQLQLFSSPAAAVPLRRAGVERLVDPDVFELDEDYNWRHDSNPEGRYGKESGRLLHARTWSRMGNAAPADFEWAPRCGALRIQRVAKGGGRLVLEGHFAPDANRLFWRSVRRVQVWEKDQMEESATRLRIALPPSDSPGFFYVEAQGVLSPVYAYPTPP